MDDVKRYTFKGAAGEYVYAPKFDAQRLRADTAEAVVAERDEALTLVNRDLIEAQTAVTGWARKHAAAEQRIAEQASMLEEMATEMTLAISDSQIRAAMTSIGRTRFLQILQAHNARVEATLNPKPEAGSHE